MTFNINQFNRSDYIEEEEAGAYQDALMELFLASPVGQARAEADPDLGFWAYQFMYYGLKGTQRAQRVHRATQRLFIFNFSVYLCVFSVYLCVTVSCYCSSSLIPDSQSPISNLQSPHLPPLA